MKICMINPPDRIYGKDDEHAFTNCTMQNLGIGYIVSVLRNAGYDTDYYDCMAMRLTCKDMISIIRQNDYKIVGLTGYGYNRYNIFKNDLEK